MLKPLTKEQTDSILRSAAGEFASKGFAGTAVSSIAKKAGVSVGVIYKYYADKEALFNACVAKSLEALDETLDNTGNSGTLEEKIDGLITQIQRVSKENPEYIRLYHQITVSGSPAGMEESAKLIESAAAKLYSGLLREAAESGELRSDISPEAFAFFFDNLLMMLHFSYACDYYQDRFRIFCGEDTLDKDEYIKEQMMRFIGGALHG
jgi:AcrR family transcriptional regulator